MRVLVYMKSFMVGVAAFLLSVILIVAFSIGTAYFTDVRRSEEIGSAGIGAVSVGVGVWWLILLPVAFAAGFWWEFRRGSRQHRA